ncbi:MAG: hypothetical protein NVS3B20_05910 [Polyangiales bacterium]
MNTEEVATSAEPKPLVGFARRDLLARFIPISVLIHAIATAPWLRILGLLLGLLGLHGGPVSWKKVDHPTVIPIDLDSLDDLSPADPAANTSADGTRSTSAQAANADGGADAGAGGDGGDAGDGAAREVGDGGDAGDGALPLPPRVRDPNSLAGGLNTLAPHGVEVNVSLLLRMDHLRAHPYAKDIGVELAAIPQWKPFLAGSGIDVMRDIDVMWAFGPRFYDTSRVTAIIVHNRPDEYLTTGLKQVSANLKGETIDDDQITAFRARVDGSPRVIVQLRGGLIVTPPDGEEQAMAIARALIKKGKTARDMVPKGERDLIVAWFLRKPSNALTAIPGDLTDTHITIRKRKDNGAVIDGDAKAKDAKHASADVKEIRTLIEASTPSLLHSYIEGYTVEANGDVVRVHHEVDFDTLNSLKAKIEFARSIGVLR